MSMLLLKFVINLENYDLSIITRHHGPLFHRWLPDGESNAIVLNTEDPNAKLKVWFERRGYVDNGFVRFDYQRKEVDPKIIPTQAILDGGPLFGLLEIQGISEEKLTCIRENKVGNEAYVKLGKKIVKKLICPPVHKFIDILRTNYGQYWIRNFDEWDSRRESLGSYCRTTLQLKWSLDGGKTWESFEPDERVYNVTLTASKDFAGYLTEKDWNELAKVVQEGYEPSLASFLLSRAQQLLDQGNLKYALVEGVSALELALNEFIRNVSQVSDSLLKLMSPFWQLPLNAQVISVAAISEKMSKEHVENAIEAINIRNKVVHEGLDPPANAEERICGLLNTVAALVLGPKFRFLTANPGNAIKSVEIWEKGD